MSALRTCAAVIFAGLMSACATTAVKPVPAPTPDGPIVQDMPIAQPMPEAPAPMPAPAPRVPAPSLPLPPPSIPYESGFSKLALWAQSNPAPALRSLQNSCSLWSTKDDEDWLDPNLKLYGRMKDWRSACAAAAYTPLDRNNAINFFQAYFEPVSAGVVREGLLTGYYAPEISVRRRADAVFSEPILARPKTKAVQNLARKDLNHNSSKVLAYGRPADVFFLQVQGSGNIKFPNGAIYMAAFDGHNSRKYKSIGRVLIERGALTRHKASKQDIENWMKANGAKATRDLINENPRYVFFKTKTLEPGVGPLGAMRVPLVAMGSMAVDPRYHPYGSLVWLDLKLPVSGGDYKGTRTGILLSAQDTGGAIKGAARGDLYFGEGDTAGSLAGVMKHKARWTVFLPAALAMRTLGTT